MGQKLDLKYPGSVKQWLAPSKTKQKRLIDAEVIVAAKTAQTIFKENEGAAASLDADFVKVCVWKGTQKIWSYDASTTRGVWDYGKAGISKEIIDKAEEAVRAERQQRF